MHVKIGQAPNALYGIRCDECGYIARVDIFWWEPYGSIFDEKHQCMDKESCAKRTQAVATATVDGKRVE